jgi:hypothetical protein
MTPPTLTPEQQAETKAQLMMGVAQLQPVLDAIINGELPIQPPQRLKDAAKEFGAALKEWADS